MTKRTFTLMDGMDLSITLAIDTEILTPELAAHIVGFWSGGDEVLEISNDDVYEAVARFAAPRLWSYMMYDGFHAAGAVATLHEQEGWCIQGPTLGITIIRCDFPSINPIDLEVEEVKS